MNHRRRRGFILLLTAVALVVLIAAAGLAIDGARLFAIRNEARAHADLAALAAARELDGTSNGILRARAAAISMPGRWSFGAEAFPEPRIEFSSGPAWVEAVRDPAVTRKVRVTVDLPRVPLYFLSVVDGQTRSRVGAAAAAEVQGEFAAEAAVDNLPVGLAASERKAGDRVALTPVLLEGPRVKPLTGLASDGEIAMGEALTKRAIVPLFGPPQEPRVVGRAIVRVTGPLEGVYEGAFRKRGARLIE